MKFLQASDRAGSRTQVSGSHSENLQATEAPLRRPFWCLQHCTVCQAQLCQRRKQMQRHLSSRLTFVDWTYNQVMDLIPEAPMKIQELKVGLRVRKGSMWRLETHVFSKWSNWGTVPRNVWKYYHLDPAVQLRECTWGTLLGAFHASITFFFKGKAIICLFFTLNAPLESLSWNLKIFTEAPIKKNNQACCHPTDSFLKLKQENYMAKPEMPAPPPGGQGCVCVYPCVCTHT